MSYYAVPLVWTPVVAGNHEETIEGRLYSLDRRQPVISYYLE